MNKHKTRKSHIHEQQTRNMCDAFPSKRWRCIYKVL